MVAFRDSRSQAAKEAELASSRVPRVRGLLRFMASPCRVLLDDTQDRRNGAIQRSNAEALALPE
jgi:hypothetical protein